MKHLLMGISAVAFGAVAFAAVAQTPPVLPPGQPAMTPPTANVDGEAIINSHAAGVPTAGRGDFSRQRVDPNVRMTPEPPPRGPSKEAHGGTPIQIDRMGSFTAGGVVMGDPAKASLSCDHGYVEYEIPVHPRAVNLWMWHSSSDQAWRNRWDGGEGYQSMFLRKGYATFMWDGPRVGRGNWSCAEVDYKPGMRDQGNFAAWRFGKTYPNWFPGVQFPTNDPEAWRQATSARYDEFDSDNNAWMEATAAGQALDVIGPSVLLTNSAGGFRAIIAALHSKNVKGIVSYENVGFVYPNGVGPAGRAGQSFGPMHIPAEEFKKLAEVPMQFVYGDNTEGSYERTMDMARQFCKAVNDIGGHCQVLPLPEAGLHGNTHIAFADMNNVAVAGELEKFLKKFGLDGYAK